MSFLQRLLPNQKPCVGDASTFEAGRAATKRLFTRVFRDFTAPCRSDSGDAMRFSRTGGGTITTTGIIPLPGVKVP